MTLPERSSMTIGSAASMKTRDNRLASASDCRRDVISLAKVATAVAAPVSSFSNAKDDFEFCETRAHFNPESGISHFG
jgi:hypothetical protein